MRTLVEVNQVAKLQPQSDRPQSCRRTATRINRRIQIGIADAEQRTRYAAVWNQARAQSEVDEPTLQRDKWTKMAIGPLELRSKQAFRYSY